MEQRLDLNNIKPGQLKFYQTDKFINVAWKEQDRSTGKACIPKWVYKLLWEEDELKPKTNKNEMLILSRTI